MNLADPIVSGNGVASDYAHALLRDLGCESARREGPADLHPAHAWANSGAMALTGHPGKLPKLVPGPIASAADGALKALRALEPMSDLPQDASGLLGERAAIAKLTRRGRIAPGGQCRLFAAKDGWLAVNLARDDDRIGLDAWLESRIAGDPWRALPPLIAGREIAPLIDRARWLGLPVASAQPMATAPPWFHFTPSESSDKQARAGSLRVVDLSGLWAGPLACSLLGSIGANVTKVESASRPDGARAGPTAFFDLLNASKASVALDFTEAKGRNALRQLIRSADVVVESARPRALEQLDIIASEECARNPNLVWVSVTGYGREDPAPGRVAFGDDAAVAAGLAAAAGRDEGAPLFCGDAIADPLTGLHAAVAVTSLWRRGIGGLLDIALRNVAAHALHFTHDASQDVRVEGCDKDAYVVVAGGSIRVAPPRARRPTSSARALGADTRAVLATIETAC